jgi:hypothetical protein
MRAPVATNACSSSRSEYVGFIGQAIAPHFQMPSSAMMNCGQFGRPIAIRSPRSTPSAINPAANRSLDFSSLS